MRVKTECRSWFDTTHSPRTPSSQPKQSFPHHFAHHPHPLCARRDRTEASGGLGEHCSSSAVERGVCAPPGRVAQPRLLLFWRGNAEGASAPGSAFFDYFLCTSKESNQLPGCPRREPVRYARPIRRVNNLKTKSPSFPLFPKEEAPAQSVAYRQTIRTPPPPHSKK